MRLIIYFLLSFINSSLYAQLSDFDSFNNSLQTTSNGVRERAFPQETDNSSQITNFSVNPNHRFYQLMKLFYNPAMWVGSVVRAAIQTYDFSFRILKTRYNSFDRRTSQAVFWTLFLEDHTTGKTKIVKIGYWNPEKESEGQKLLRFQNELLRRGFPFNEYFHPIDEVFLSKDLKIEMYFQDFLPHETLLSHWDRLRRIRQVSTFFSTVGRISAHLALLHAKTACLFDDDLRSCRGLASLRCLVHGDLTPANILVSVENNFFRFIDNITSAMALQNGGYALQDIVYFLCIFFDKELHTYAFFGEKMDENTKKGILDNFCDAYTHSLIGALGFSDAQIRSVNEQMRFIKEAFCEIFIGDPCKLDKLVRRHFVFVGDRLSKE